MSRPRRPRSHVATALIVAAFLVTALGLVGCATTRHDHLESLRSAVEAYNHAYRWQNFEQAAGYLPAELQAPFLATHDEESPSLRIESYQILKVEFETERSATASVLLRYMLLPSVTLERRLVTQRWHQVAGRWVLEAEDNAVRPIDRGYLPGP